MSNHSYRRDRLYLQPVDQRPTQPTNSRLTNILEKYLEFSDQLCVSSLDDRITGAPIGHNWSPLVTMLSSRWATWLMVEMVGMVVVVEVVVLVVVAMVVLEVLVMVVPQLDSLDMTEHFTYFCLQFANESFSHVFHWFWFTCSLIFSNVWNTMDWCSDEGVRSEAIVQCISSVSELVSVRAVLVFSSGRANDKSME